jgi:hypothetical protein
MSIGSHGIQISGTVIAVVTAEASLDGSACFRIDFSTLKSSERSSLVNLLREAQARGVSLSPPPPRRNTRFPISWPVAIISGANRFNAAALDISKGGLFIATPNHLDRNALTFGLPLDQRGPGVQGSARIARIVSDDMARERGLERGYGLRFEAFSSADKQPFIDFLQRIRRRSQKHIAVAASGSRQAALAQSLTSAGYAVTSADSVDLLLERAHFQTHPPDVAVVDASVSELGHDRRDFEAAFARFQVPYVDTSGNAPFVTRQAVDRILAVGA